MTGEEALAALEAGADSEKAAKMAAYHKAERRYIGLANGDIDALVAEWRAVLDVPGRVALADALWRSDIFEARVASSKLLTQARIKDDEAVWRLLVDQVKEFNSWAIADHAAAAGSRRLVAAPHRLDEIEPWVSDENMWVRRAAFTFTLPWARQNHPGGDDLTRRERVLGWAAASVDDREWFIQKAIAWWLRTLSKHDAERVQAFLTEFGERMKPFAKREASKYL